MERHLAAFGGLPKRHPTACLGVRLAAFAGATTERRLAAFVGVNGKH